MTPCQGLTVKEQNHNQSKESGITRLANSRLMPDRISRKGHETSEQQGILICFEITAMATAKSMNDQYRADLALLNRKKFQ
jgi:hypothetical protein